jgi:hypothetical protein
MAGIALEFTTTSCNRPGILDMTYSSYVSRLKGVDFQKSTLYINVDPAPDSSNISEMEKVAKKYFGKVIINYPKEPNFAAAVIWCFSQVKGEYFFHLEDDWMLKQKVDIAVMIKRVGEHNIQCVLNKKVTLRNELWEPCLVPSLFRTEIVKRYLPLMSSTTNPEYQMKMIFRKNTNGLKAHKSVLWRKSHEISKDIGRDWLKKNGIARDYAKTGGSSAKWSPWITWRTKKK